MSNTDVGLRIRRELSRYLAGRMTLRQFTAWLTPITFKAFEGAEPDVESLVSEIELRLAEFADGHWTEDALRGLLRPIAVTYASTFTGTAGKPQIVSGTASSTQSSLNYSVSVADKSLAGVSG